MTSDPRNKDATGQRINGHASASPSVEEPAAREPGEDLWQETFGTIDGPEGPPPLLHRSPDPNSVAKSPSIAPVAADRSPLPPVGQQPKPPDLLPRIVTVTVAGAVMALFALYTIRRPPQNTSTTARDAETLISGVQEPQGPLARPAAGWATAPQSLQRLSGNEGDIERVRGEDPGDLVKFDLGAALASLDDAEQRARSCWAEAGVDSVTLSIRFVPEGYAVAADVKDPDLVGSDAVACFEHAFRRTRVAPYTGDETTLWRTIRRP